ncbi:MAG TPA: FAD-dependent oxidoreductase [Eubacteriales bacterium]|nr:FAD-dependent oxidoreductase [Eubacteriales bacterium]
MIDIIIVGAGAAGMTAALYALRSGKSVLLLEQETIGGQVAISPRVENFPSLKQIKGSEFANNLFEQITALGAELELEKVIEIKKDGEVFTVVTDYNTHQAKAVIIAAGVKHKHLGLPKETDFVGHGVSYCAVCDGAFFKGKEVALVGDANSALQYSLLLSNYCPKVHMFTLFDKFFGDESLVKALKSKENIIVYPDTQIVGLIGENELEGITYKNKKGEICEHRTEALFIAIGQLPDNKSFVNLVDLDKEGYIIAGEDCATKTQGLYVAGDCRTKKIRQLTTASSDGAIAGLAACAYITNLGIQK